jgi:selenoprotein W-related protein
VTEQILNQKLPEIGSVRLIPSSGGVFEVTANGRLVFSKKQTGRRPEVDEILAALSLGGS